MIDRITKLRDSLLEKYEHTLVNLIIFPSQAATLDLKSNESLFVFEYSPKEGFAISKLVTVEDAWNPLKCEVFSISDFKAAEEYFLSLVETGN
jgi:hypothetical protein